MPPGKISSLLPLLLLLWAGGGADAFGAPLTRSRTRTEVKHSGESWDKEENGQSAWERWGRLVVGLTTLVAPIASGAGRNTVEGE
jgi:hypothetical protein